jgi:hypothetical protein
MKGTFGMLSSTHKLAMRRRAVVLVLFLVLIPIIVYCIL